MQDQVEASDCCRPGAASRGGQLRRLPAPIRRAYIWLLALPGSGNGGGASGTQHSGPLLQTSGGGSGGGQHAAEAVAIPPLPGGGHRPGLAWSLVRRPALARPRGVAVQLLQQPPVTAESTPEPAPSEQAQLRGGGLSPARLDVSTSHTVYIHTVYIAQCISTAGTCVGQKARILQLCVRLNPQQQRMFQASFVLNNMNTENCIIITKRAKLYCCRLVL